MEEGEGFQGRKGVPGGFVGWFLCRPGGFPMQEGGSVGVPGKVPVQEGGGAVPKSHAHATAHTQCPVQALKQPSSCIASAADPWQAALTIYLPDCIVNPSNQTLRFKGDRVSTC